MTASDSIFGTAQEQAEQDIASAVARSRERMDVDEARLVREIESYVAHPSQERQT